jgi:hypothetical protein
LLREEFYYWGQKVNLELNLHVLGIFVPFSYF